MKKISLHTFKHTIRDIHKHTDNRKFCFVIGAGASFKSGIPTGEQLAGQWYQDIKDRYSAEELQQWVEDGDIDESDIAAHYGSIYRKRFETDKISGYEFLVQAMRKAKPTFGHIVLAQILTKAPGNCILTTNFDSLIESSIYQYTDKTPLVCGHESLSGYARPSSIHPLIIKIHRDLLLSPKSDPEEINQLDVGWKEPLDNIFSSHIPIVIGYGGNDGSLMEYFEKISKTSNFFWCGLKGTLPSLRVYNLIEKMDGNYVEIDGFDEMMQELLWVFDEIKPIKEELEAITKSRVEAMSTQLEILNSLSDSEVSIKSFEKELSAFEYSTMADNEPDYEKRKVIYLEALEKFPKTAWLWNKITYFLHFVKKDYSHLEDYYLGALSIDPDNAISHGNYAIYLENIKKEYDLAEKHYLIGLSIDPENADSIGNYACFLNENKNDFDNAEKHYLKALYIDSENAKIQRDYAIFLGNIRKDFDNAEKHYLKALSIDPDDAVTNGCFAKFLSEIKKDSVKAEKYFLKALAINPEDSINNGSYAIFLSDIKKDFEKAEKYFQLALSFDSENANNYGNYALFLEYKIKDYKKAEEYFLKALNIDNEDASINGNYAIFLNNIRKNNDLAETHYLKALKSSPEDGNSNGNYARFLLITNRIHEATKYLERAFQLNNNENNDLLIELLFYKYAHYIESFEEAEKAIEALLQDGVRSIGWNFDQNIEVAIKNGHPNTEKLKIFARRISTNED